MLDISKYIQLSINLLWIMAALLPVVVTMSVHLYMLSIKWKTWRLRGGKKHFGVYALHSEGKVYLGSGCQNSWVILCFSYMIILEAIWDRKRDFILCIFLCPCKLGCNFKMVYERTTLPLNFKDLSWDSSDPLSLRIHHSFCFKFASGCWMQVNSFVPVY